jgi:hypothetical protein
MLTLLLPNVASFVVYDSEAAGPLLMDSSCFSMMMVVSSTLSVLHLISDFSTA